MNKDKGFRLAAATGLHKGDRDYQQDQLGLFAHPRVPGCVLGVVADGMDGRTTEPLRRHRAHGRAALPLTRSKSVV